MLSILQSQSRNNIDSGSVVQGSSVSLSKTVNSLAG